MEVYLNNSIYTVVLTSNYDSGTVTVGDVAAKEMEIVFMIFQHRINR